MVPRRVVIEACHQMLRDGLGDAQIAKFVQDHVKIVLITKEECERLDRKAHPGLGLRQHMPAGWAVGDNVFARLTAAGISWKPTPG